MAEWAKIEKAMPNNSFDIGYIMRDARARA